MTRLTQENLLAAAMFFFFIGILVLSGEYGTRARLVPVPIAVLGILMLGAQVIWQNLRPADELNVDILEFLTRRGIDPTAAGKAGGDSSAEAPSPDSGPVDSPPKFKREVFAFGKVAAFVALFMLFGPFPSIFIFTFAYLSLSRHYRWAKSMAVTTIFVAVVYALFVEILDIQLYHGVLEPLINSY